MYKYACVENFDKNGNGWEWKILKINIYTQEGGKVREPKFPTIYNLRQKNFEKKLKKNFFDFENFEMKKEKENIK